MTTPPCDPPPGHPNAVHPDSPVFHAYPRAAGDEVPALVLTFNKPIKDPRDTPGWSYDVAKAEYNALGRALCLDLLHSLPGGLIDALFGALCEYKASVFLVPHIPPVKE